MSVAESLYMLGWIADGVLPGALTPGNCPTAGSKGRCPERFVLHGKNGLKMVIGHKEKNEISVVKVGLKNI